MGAACILIVYERKRVDRNYVQTCRMKFKAQFMIYSMIDDIFFACFLYDELRRGG